MLMLATVRTHVTHVQGLLVVTVALVSGPAQEETPLPLGSSPAKGSMPAQRQFIVKVVQK
jgi:hypothetical protein